MSQALRVWSMPLCSLDSPGVSPQDQLVSGTRAHVPIAHASRCQAYFTQRKNLAGELSFSHGKKR